MLQFPCLQGLIKCEAKRGMAGSFSTYGLKTALSVSWQGIVVFWADSDHLQRLMCHWATEAVISNQELHVT